MSGKNLDNWLLARRRRPLLMGVLNITPDSFSDGGSYLDHSAAITRGMQMLAEGATILDVGGESTRPGSESVDATEQIRRTQLVIQALAQRGAIVSIDTTSAAVAEAAIEAGATIVNDIAAGHLDPAMLSLVARTGAAIVLVHMRGTPRTMQEQPTYDDVVAEVVHFLTERADACRAAGIAPHRILVDVGIGFGKTLEHNLELLRYHRRFAELGYATVLGTSRKGFIGTLTNRPVASERVMGTAATIAWGLTNGADILRVHDVAAMREVMEVITAIRGVDPAQSSPTS
jgi:dihydropteroate synthase